MPSRLENLGTIVVIIIAILPLINQLAGQDNLLSWILFGAIALFVIIYFIYDSIKDYIKGKFSQIDKISKRMEDIERSVDYMKRIHELDKRVSVLESQKSRKGMIDPRIIIIIFLLILLYFYLKSIGLL